MRLQLLAGVQAQLVFLPQTEIVFETSFIPPLPELLVETVKLVSLRTNAKLTGNLLEFCRNTRVRNCSDLKQQPEMATAAEALAPQRQICRDLSCTF